ncbi:ParB/RepB/Spo0J family partition protein [Gordonia sp. (in: high G+C Gram-positive bacteria)]|uniref:ParB/RepB/Spo0J family partition protein n=1 Tax=Gordonia sp. (in: high G+C Gram-positive bacteria) TaxID=84139 RepID=UPI003C789933
MPSTPQATEIPVDQIQPNPDNPRRDASEVETLAASIKAQGILQALTVAPLADNPDQWIVIDGHRRHAAAQHLKLDVVPCIVRTDLTDPADQIGAMLATAREREPLTAAEEASGVQSMLDLGESVATIAARTGMSKTKVRQRAKVATLSATVLEKVHTHAVTLADAEFIATAKASYRDELEKALGTNDWAACKKRIEARINRDARVSKQLREAAALGITVLDTTILAAHQVADDHGVVPRLVKPLANQTWSKAAVEALTDEQRALAYARVYDFENVVSLLRYEIISDPTLDDVTASAASEGTAPEGEGAAGDADPDRAADWDSEVAERIAAKAKEREERDAARAARREFLTEFPAADQDAWVGRLLALDGPFDGWFIDPDAIVPRGSVGDEGAWAEAVAEWVRGATAQQFAWHCALSVIDANVDHWLHRDMTLAADASAESAAEALTYIDLLREMGHVLSNHEQQIADAYNATVLGSLAEGVDQ